MEIEMCTINIGFNILGNVIQEILLKQRVTLSQTTNFGLFQNERVCRRQF